MSANGGGVFRNIVHNANNALNSEKAARIRKILIICGGTGIIIGLVVFAVGMYLFVSTGFSNFGKDMNIGLMVGSMLMVPGGWLLVAVGLAAVSAGMKIIVAGAGAKIIDTYDKCPKCGDKVETDEMYCDKCGEPLLKMKLCSCGTQNDLKSGYCKTCGKRL